MTTNKHRPRNPFKPALAGLKFLLLKERNFRIHLVIMVLVLIACAFFRVQVYEWIAVLLAIGLVLAAEGLNTAIERLCDYACADYHPLIKKVKDISAGAVLVCAFISVIIGGIIFIPYLYKLFFG